MAFDKIISNLEICAILFVAITIASTGAFNSHIPRISELNIQSTKKDHGYINKREKVILNGWLSDTFQSLGLDIALEKLRFNPQIPQQQDEESTKSKYGTVIRTAVKGYSEEASKPSSRAYTTRKESRGEITIGLDGVHGDYNHYRTIALSSTPDRAVSILTTDILKMLKDAGWKSVNEGDLGENVYVDGIDYTFFEIGKRYSFQTKGSAEKDEGTVVEITERIEPCGNLCKLPYINDENIPPKERFEGCKKFLLWLDEKEGLRGWYGKIIGEGGAVKLGDQVSALVVAA
jgi:MOSC domain-containing protein YiiM